MPTPLRKAEGYISCAANARRKGIPRGRRTTARTDTSDAETGRAADFPSIGKGWDGPRSLGAQFGHARFAAVGHPRSTEEAVEQRNGRSEAMAENPRTRKYAEQENPQAEATSRPAETVEGRGMVKGNPRQGDTFRMQSRVKVYTEWSLKP